MTSAPLPPSDIASRTPEIIAVKRGAIFERFFNAAFDPIYFNKDNIGRFNAPDHSFGVLYAAAGLRGAFAETFLRQPGMTLLSLDFIRQKARVKLRTTRELKLIKLSGYGLARLGATAQVVHGGLPYDVPQKWSKALYAHPKRPDGIAYTARHDDEALCYALYDHKPTYVEEVSRDINLDQDWFWEMAERYGVGLDER